MASYFMTQLQIYTDLSNGFEDFIKKLSEDHGKIYLLLHNDYKVIKNVVVLPK